MSDICDFKTILVTFKCSDDDNDDLDDILLIPFTIFTLSQQWRVKGKFSLELINRDDDDEEFLFK